jgi:hypothetical protein
MYVQDEVFEQYSDNSCIAVMRRSTRERESSVSMILVWALSSIDSIQEHESVHFLFVLRNPKGPGRCPSQRTAAS